MSETARNKEGECFALNRYRNFRFTRESIADNAPAASGVYGLYNALWIYIGETENIQAKLLEHVADKDGSPWAGHYRPSGFAFEILPEAAERTRRLQELLDELEPLAQNGSRKSRK